MKASTETDGLVSIDAWVLRGATIEQAIHEAGVHDPWEAGSPVALRGHAVYRKFAVAGPRCAWIQARYVVRRDRELQFALRTPSGGLLSSTYSCRWFPEPDQYSSVRAHPQLRARLEERNESLEEAIDCTALEFDVSSSSLDAAFAEGVRGLFEFVLVGGVANAAPTFFGGNMGIWAERTQPRQFILHASAPTAPEPRFDALAYEFTFLEADELPAGLKERVLATRERKVASYPL